MERQAQEGDGIPPLLMRQLPEAPQSARKGTRTDVIHEESAQEGDDTPLPLKQS